MARRLVAAGAALAVAAGLAGCSGGGEDDSGYQLVQSKVAIVEDAVVLCAARTEPAAGEVLGLYLVGGSGFRLGGGLSVVAPTGWGCRNTVAAGVRSIVVAPAGRAAGLRQEVRLQTARAPEEAAALAAAYFPKARARATAAGLAVPERPAGERVTAIDSQTVATFVPGRPGLRNPVRGRVFHGRATMIVTCRLPPEPASTCTLVLSAMTAQGLAYVSP